MDENENIVVPNLIDDEERIEETSLRPRNLREYIAETTENPLLDTEILEVGDGLAITKMK